MKISVVLAHPKKGSFNHAIAKTVVDAITRNKHDVIYHDLYEENFNAVLPSGEISVNGEVDETIKKHCREIASADGIIIIHPNWWGQPPAIMKGWVDRVFRSGVAYEFLENDSGEGIPRGLLKARAAVVLNTSNTAEDREHNVFGDPLDTIWRNCIFDLCGVKIIHRKVFQVIVTSTPEQRGNWLNEVAALVDNYLIELQR